MIYKSIIILAIICRMLSLNSLADRFDDSIYKAETNKSRASASYNLTLPLISKNPIIDKLADKPKIYAESYILTDVDTNTVILKNNAKNRVPVASTTKIMTAVVVLENYKLSDVVTISAVAANQAGSEAFLKVGEKITVGELLRCMLIKSANDSAYALAEHMNKNGQTGALVFIDKMNQKAKELGMNDTLYKDPAGLDVTGYSTASDLYIITKFALQNKIFAEIVRTKTYTAYNINKSISHPLDNSNRLVNGYDYIGAIGVKTGYMPEAGHCLVSAVKREGHTLVGVVLHTFADTATASADESRKLQDWGWANTKW